MQQKIKEESMKVEIIDRQQQIEVSEHEIKRKLCELDSQIKRPAEAEKYRLEKIAGAIFYSYPVWPDGESISSQIFDKVSQLGIVGPYPFDASFIFCQMTNFVTFFNYFQWCNDAKHLFISFCLFINYHQVVAVGCELITLYSWPKHLHHQGQDWVSLEHQSKFFQRPTNYESFSRPKPRLKQKPLKVKLFICCNTLIHWRFSYLINDVIPIT